MVSMDLNLEGPWQHKTKATELGVEGRDTAPLPCSQYPRDYL